MPEASGMRCVTSEEVKIRLGTPIPPSATQQPPTTKGKSPARDLDSILKRLIKLKTTKRAAAINSIKAMFQLTDPMDDQEANRILESLHKRGSLSIDANDKLKFRTSP